MPSTSLFLLAHLEVIIDQVLTERTTAGKAGWQEICTAHPSDIADLAENISSRYQRQLFAKLPLDLAAEAFDRLHYADQASIICKIDDDRAAHVLKYMSADDLADLVDHLSDEKGKHYLKLLQKKQRSRIINLLSFHPKSAGGIMNSEVFTLHADHTVKNSIGMLQRVTGHQEIRYRVYVTDEHNILGGHITLDKLIVNKSDTPVRNFLEKNELTIPASLDQEEAVTQMTHYGVLNAPVVDDHGHFLGIISGDDLIEVLEEEASEDAYMMSGVGHVEHSYFETPVPKMLYERSKWLIGLLLFQSVSSFIMTRYDQMLTDHVIISLFLTMLIGTGGNAGNQSATLVIRGLATGEISRSKRLALLLREFGLSILIASLLSAVSFARVWFMHANLPAALAISSSLFCIVMASMMLGTLIPLTLNRLGIDPAHSAAPFLSTLMDIIGIVIYCSICSWLLLA